MYPRDPVSVTQQRNTDLRMASEINARQQLMPRRENSGYLERPLKAFAAAFRRRQRPTQHAVVGPYSSSHDLFRGLSQSQLATLATHLELRACMSGESLGRQNQPAEEFVIVLDAQIGVSIDGIPITVLDYGSHFGALPLLDGGDALHRASFDVLSPGRVAVVDKQRFRGVLDQFPTIAICTYEMASFRRDYLAQLEACETSQSLGRSARMLLEYPVHIRV